MSHPGILEPPDDPHDPADRPDWLRGAEEDLAATGQDSIRVVPDRAAAPAGPPRTPIEPPAKLRDGGEAGGPTTPWTTAASSVPRLTVEAKRELPAWCPPLPDDSAPAPVMGEEDTGEEAAAPVAGTVGSIAPPDEPWWLIWIEELWTNRRLQAGILGALAVVAAVALWPRGHEQGASLGQIKRHPEKYEGRAVRVRGEVGDVFEIGQGYVFHLLQGRDSVVVFSPTRRPSPQERIAVVGTVCTGYLDGVPRVAIFETPGAASRTR